MRAALVVAALLIAIGAIWIGVSASVAPLRVDCSAFADDEVACEAAVEAVRRRGLPALHPLILSASVEPGPAPRADQLGHRATVRYAFLGGPDLSIALFYDQGAHWGGLPDRDDEEVGAWALVPLVLGGLIAAGLIGLARRWRGHDASRTAAADTT